MFSGKFTGCYTPRVEWELFLSYFIGAWNEAADSCPGHHQVIFTTSHMLLLPQESHKR